MKKLLGLFFAVSFSVSAAPAHYWKYHVGHVYGYAAQLSAKDKFEGKIAPRITWIWFAKNTKDRVNTILGMPMISPTCPKGNATVGYWAVYTKKNMAYQAAVHPWGTQTTFEGPIVKGSILWAMQQDQKNGVVEQTPPDAISAWVGEQYNSGPVATGC